MSLAHHYIAYRAHVRAKVACLRHEQGDEEAATEAKQLLDLSHRHLTLGQVMLVLVGGLPGSGKSTLSKGLGDALGGIVLRSDEVRKELAGVAKGSSAAPYEEGIYRRELTQLTYQTLLDRARMLLGNGETVVLDASWTDSRWRPGALDVAESTSSVLVQIRCHVDMKEAARRIGERAEAGGDASDASIEVAKRMAAEADPWPEAFEVDTSGPKEATLQTALSVIREAT
jgi:predicted kinase